MINIEFINQHKVLINSLFQIDINEDLPIYMESLPGTMMKKIFSNYKLYKNPYRSNIFKELNRIKEHKLSLNTREVIDSIDINDNKIKTATKFFIERKQMKKEAFKQLFEVIEKK